MTLYHVRPRRACKRKETIKSYYKLFAITQIGCQLLLLSILSFQFLVSLKCSGQSFRFIKCKE